MKPEPDSHCGNEKKFEIGLSDYEHICFKMGNRN